MRPYIFHITTRSEWEAALKKGLYSAPSLEKEGVIHCCGKWQLNSVAKRYFDGITGLVILEIFTKKLKSQVVMETSPLIEEDRDSTIYVNVFASVYGPINTDAVTSIKTFNFYMQTPLPGEGPNPFS